VVTENRRLHLPINQKILTASPYLVVHTVHRVQQPARPLMLSEPNIQHQTQCDPGVNTSAMNSINVLGNILELKHPFPITIADHTVPDMTSSVCGTFVLHFLDGSTCDINV
jgi:hypothetical protein